MSAAATPTDAPRQRILDAALELLSEHGYEGMSLQRVADRVGLHKSSLFHHFKSKEELANEVYRGLAERLMKRIEPLLASVLPLLLVNWRRHLVLLAGRKVLRPQRRRFASMLGSKSAAVPGTWKVTPL